MIKLKFNDQENLQYENNKQDSQSEDDFKVIKEGYMYISSPAFMDESHYASVKGKNPSEYKLVDIVGSEITVSALGSLDKNPKYSPTLFRKNADFGTNSDIPYSGAFYFRLSKNNLYYTNSKDDMLVKGALSISNVIDASGKLSQIAGWCFRVIDKEVDEWTLCPFTQEDEESWRCSIKEQIGYPCKDATPQEDDQSVAEEKTQQPIYLVSLPSPYCNDGWNYEKQGMDWQCKCHEGEFQSPVNLRKYCVQPNKQLQNKFMLNQSAIFQFSDVNSDDYDLVYEDQIIKIKCNRDSTGCKDRAFGKVIDVDYNEYYSHEIHFHTPAEHTIEDRSYHMEIHAIFLPLTQEAFRNKLILSWLVENYPGGNNEFISKLDLLNLPNYKSPKKKISDKNVKMNLQGMFITKMVDKFDNYFNYFYYNGSLTQPQCDEHIKWVVVADPIPLGMSVYQMFNDAHGKYVKNYRGNNRMVQMSNDRKVFYFDTKRVNCGTQTTHKDINDVFDGHFEKFNAEQKTYFFVEGEDPSGVNEAKQLSQEENVDVLKTFKEMNGLPT